MLDYKKFPLIKAFWFEFKAVLEGKQTVMRDESECTHFFQKAWQITHKLCFYLTPEIIFNVFYAPNLHFLVAFMINAK